MLRLVWCGCKQNSIAVSYRLDFVEIYVYILEFIWDAHNTLHSIFDRGFGVDVGKQLIDRIDFCYTKHTLNVLLGFCCGCKQNSSVISYRIDLNEVFVLICVTCDFRLGAFTVHIRQTTLCRWVSKRVSTTGNTGRVNKWMSNTLKQYYREQGNNHLIFGV